MNLNLLVHPSKRKGGAKSGEKWATRPKARDWRTTENMSLTPWEGSWWLRSRHPVVQGGRADRMCQFCCAVNSKGIRNFLQRVLWCVFLAQETGGDQIQMQLQQPFSHNSSSIIYRTWWILLQNLCSVLVELDVPPWLSVWSQIRLATSISKLSGAQQLSGAPHHSFAPAHGIAHIWNHKSNQCPPQSSMIHGSAVWNTASVKAAKGQQWRRPSTRRKNSGHRNHRSVASQNHGNIELK